MYTDKRQLPPVKWALGNQVTSYWMCVHMCTHGCILCIDSQWVGLHTYRSFHNILEVERSRWGCGMWYGLEFMCYKNGWVGRTRNSAEEGKEGISGRGWSKRWAVYESVERKNSTRTLVTYSSLHGCCELCFSSTENWERRVLAQRAAAYSKI